MASLKQKIIKLVGGRASQHEPDSVLILVAAALVVFGLVMLASASGSYSYFKYGDGYFLVKHQLVSLFAGLLLYWFFSRTDYHLWRRYAFHLLLFSILLLLLVFIPGLEAKYGAAKSWIKVLGFSFQPSEFVKLTFLIYLAAWVESRGERLKDLFQGTAPFLIVLAVISFLMLLQPDFGTLFIIGLTSLAVFWSGESEFKHLAIMLALGLGAMALMITFTPHQSARFKCFFDPGSDTKENCYQINQSLIAVGSGGFWGRGFGASRQKLLYLPEVYGDSIFAVIAEELGFLFAGGLIILFLFLFYRGFLISRRSPDLYGKLVAIGIVSWITSQALINIGGMINLIPMTGVPLPFISYGGTAIIAVLSATGILVNISKQTKN